MRKLFSISACIVSLLTASCAQELIATRSNPTLMAEKVPSPMTTSQMILCSRTGETMEDTSEHLAALKGHVPVDAIAPLPTACSALKDALADDGVWKVDAAPFLAVLQTTGSNSVQVPVVIFSDRCTVNEMGVRTCRGTKTDFALYLLSANGTILWRGSAAAEPERAQFVAAKLFDSVPGHH